MSEQEEVERYRRLLEDWKPSPPTKHERSRSGSVATPVNPAQTARSTPSQATTRTAMGTATYAPGAILLLNGRMLAVYRRAVPEKEYHLVLLLCPNNAIKIQGVALEGYEVEEIGNLPPAWVDQMQSEMRWERDLMVFHCYRYEDVAKIPTSEGMEEPRMANLTNPQTSTSNNGGNGSAKPETRSEQPNGVLRRGQRLKIKFGNNSWEAVYWGKDDQGQVIAHQTYEKWSLMHLDLKRFENGMAIQSEPDQALIQEIEQSLMNA